MTFAWDWIWNLKLTFPRFDGHTEEFVVWTGGVCMGKKDSRYFTREFKRNAVQMIIEKGCQ